MFIVKPVAWNEGHEELGAVGVRSSVGHREVSSSSVLDIEVLILELHAVDRLSSCSVSSSEVSALGHELSDHSVERGSLVVKWSARFTNTLLSSAETSEVLSSSGSLVCVQLHDDSSGLLTANGDIKEDNWVRH